MNEAQIHRYARHISLGSVGYAGQQRLLAATVCLEAGGDPASHCAIIYLAAAGVGRIEIGGGDDEVFADEVSRSLLFGARDIGGSRLEAFARCVAELNRDVAIAARDVGSPEPITVEVAESLAEGLELGCAAAARVIAELARGHA